MSHKVHQYFIEIKDNLPLRRKWINLRCYIEAMNAYFDLSGPEAITQAKFLKHIVNSFKYDDKLYSRNDDNTHGIFIHTASTIDEGDAPNRRSKRKRYFIYVTKENEFPLVFKEQKEWLSEACFQRIQIRRGGGVDKSEKNDRPQKETFDPPPSEPAPISSWESKEYWNYFGCKDDEHPLDAIETYVALLNLVKKGFLRKSVVGYKESQSYLVSARQRSILFQKSVYIIHFLTELGNRYPLPILLMDQYQETIKYYLKTPQMCIPIRNPKTLRKWYTSF